MDATDFTLPDEILKEVIQSENRDYLVIGGYVNHDQCEVILWTGHLQRFTIPLYEFEPNAVTSPDFHEFSIIDYGQTIKFGEYEAAVDSLAMYFPM